MKLLKGVLSIGVVVLGLAVSGIAFATDVFDDAVPAADPFVEETPGESLASPKLAGKTMEEVVAEAKAGFPKKFADTEVLTVMDASRKLYDSDRELSRKLERIASKMSAL